MTFTCGCQPPTYCPTHRDSGCHSRPTAHSFEQVNWDNAEGETRIGVLQEMVVILLNRLGECPPCRTARWASVNLDSRATPTRNPR